MKCSKRNIAGKLSSSRWEAEYQSLQHQSNTYNHCSNRSPCEYVLQAHAVGNPSIHRYARMTAHTLMQLVLLCLLCRWLCHSARTGVTLTCWHGTVQFQSSRPGQCSHRACCWYHWRRRPQAPGGPKAATGRCEGQCRGLSVPGGVFGDEQDCMCQQGL